MKRYAVAISIGARLGRSFDRALRRADVELMRVGRHAARLQVARSSALGGSLERLRRRAGRAAGALGGLAGRLTRFHREERSARHETDRFTRATDKNARAVRRQAAGIGAAGRALRRLGKDAAQAARLSGGLGGIRSIAAGLAGAALTRQVLAVDLAKFRLSTVLNAPDKRAAMAQAQAVAESMAKGGVSTLPEAYAIQYALNSGGLSAEAARAGAPVVGRIATITGGVAEQVGEVITTAYNNLGSTLEGTAGERFKRIGELLTKVQFKYQIRDFGQLGESMKYGASAMARYNVSLAQGVVLLGRLNSAGLQGSMAGTALAAMLRGLSKAQDEWGIGLVRDAKGQLDLVATLTQIRDVMAGLDRDQAAAALQKVFGDEGARAVTPLLNALDKLAAEQQEVEKTSRGIIDANFNAYLETATGNLKRFTGTLSAAGIRLANYLLPAVNAALPELTAVVDVMGRWAAANPAVIKGVAALAGGLLALKAGMFVLSPLTSLFRGGRALLSRRRSRRRAGRRMLGGGLAHGGAIPVSVVNWPSQSGIGFGDLLDTGGAGGGRRRRSARRRQGLRSRSSRRPRTRVGRLMGAIRERASGVWGWMKKAGSRLWKGLAKSGVGKLVAKGTGGMWRRLAQSGLGRLFAKGLGKGLLKKIPVVSILAGVGFGISRALAGDWLGAAGELLSGVAGTIPGIGTAVSVATDAALAARDMVSGETDSSEQTAPQRKEPPLVHQVRSEKGAITINVTQKNELSGLGRDARGIEALLEDGAQRLRRLIEETVTEMFARQQRVSLGNVGL